MKQFFFCVFLLIAMNVQAASLPMDELPMYGGAQKTDEVKKREEAMITVIEKGGSSRTAAAKDLVKSAFKYTGKGRLSSAIKGFNQAWLLDPENGDVYYGFALITELRKGNAAEIEKYYRMAVAKPAVSVEGYVDYGRFLLLQNRFDESLSKLQKALELSPAAQNARAYISLAYQKKGDLAKACEWAKGALVNHDQLAPGYLEGVCQPAGMK